MWAASTTVCPSGVSIRTPQQAIRNGIGLVPDFTARAALAGQRVVPVLSEWELCEPYAGAVHAVYMPGRHLALKVRAFIDYLVDAHTAKV